MSSYINDTQLYHWNLLWNVYRVYIFSLARCDTPSVMLRYLLPVHLAQSNSYLWNLVWFSGNIWSKNNVMLLVCADLCNRWGSDFIKNLSVAICFCKSSYESRRRSVYMLMWSYTGTFIPTKQAQIHFTLQNWTDCWTQWKAERKRSVKCECIN